jgi:zinc protease
MNPAKPSLLRLLSFSLLIVFTANTQAEEPRIPYTRVTLNNGLTVIVHEDNKAPIVAVNIWYHVGSKNEVPGRTGFAHLFEHLMYQGSENLDDEYLLFLQQLGATNLNATTWFDRTNYFETVPKNALDTVLWLESDRMGHFVGAITQDKLDEQRGVVQNEKRQSDNQPYGKVWDLLLTQVFPPGHPYSWSTIGSMEDLDAATIDDVKDWFETYYGPNNAVLVIAGDVETDAVIAQVEKYFGDIPPGPPLIKPESWTPVHMAQRRHVIEDRVPQARLYMAWPGPRWGTREADLLSLATHIMSGDKNSRLFKRLVYTDQIATDVTLAHQALEISGLTYLIATAQPETGLTKIEVAVNEEIERFIESGPTRKELERAKIDEQASFLRSLERIGGQSGKAGILAQNMVYGDSPDHYQTRMANIAAATTKDIRQVAEQWLDKGALVIEVHPYPELAASIGGADRTTYPVPGEFPEVGFPAFERSRLANGLEVIIASRPAAPIVEMSLILDAGYAADQFSGPGTATMTMAMIDEGTIKKSALEINDALAMEGAHLAAGSNLDSSYVQLSALSEKLDASLEIYADVILNPSFPENELDRLRRNALAKIGQEQTRPISMALRALPRLMYGEDHPYGQPLTGSGTQASINEINRAGLVQFHDTWFKPNNATLVVVGDVSKDRLMPKLQDLFGQWEQGEVPGKDLSTTKPTQTRLIHLVDRPDSDQTVIFAGQLLPPKANPDEMAIQAMNDILGGLSSSRINMNLREDKGWSYGAYSLIVDARGQRPLLAYAPVQTDKTRESVEELFNEIYKIRSERPPTEAELSIVKDSNTLSLPGRWEGAADVLGSISQIVRFGLPDDYWSVFADRVNSLDVPQVIEAANTYIRPDDIVWVVVGDLKKIEPGLRELEFDEIRLIDADGVPITSE